MSEQNKTPETEAKDAQTSEASQPEASTEGGASVKLDSFDGDAAKQAASQAAARGAEQSAEPAPAESPTPDPEPALDDVAALRARVSELETQLSAKEDQHLRAVAEIQNIRRRSERDRREAETFGGTKLARDLLAVFDNLDEALRQASEALKENEAGFFNGVELTRKVMLDGMAKHQITQVQPEIGEKFDPNRHQAMYEAPAPGAEPGSVIQVMQSGFMIADRLLRPAMVGVASAASGGAPSGSGDDGAENRAANG